MIGAINPIEYPQAWDQCTIKGVDTPPYCVLKGWKRPSKWDTKIGKGTAGATSTFVGKPPAKGSITFYAWTIAHFETWDILLPLLAFDPKSKTSQAIDIYHPALADLDVSAVVVDDGGIGIWEDDGKGLWSRTIDFLEYLPAPKASVASTPSGSASTSTTPGTAPPGTVPDPYTVELQKQRDQAAIDAQKALNP